MPRFSPIAASVLSIAAASLGAATLPAAQPVQASASANGGVGALTLEHVPSLLSPGWMDRAEVAATAHRRRLDASLVNQQDERERASLAEFLAAPRLYAPAPAAATDTRAAEGARAAFEAAAASTPADAPLPADYAGSAYGLHPASAASAAVPANFYRPTEETAPARSVVPEDDAYATPVRPSTWQAAAPATPSSGYVFTSVSPYSTWGSPALSRHGSSAASPVAPAAVASTRPVLGATTPVGAPAPRAVPAGSATYSLTSSDGNASTQTASFGITPSAGTNQFLLTTINPAGSVPASLGTTPADTNVATLNSFFGLASGTLAGRGAADGSGYLSQTLNLGVGSTVSFDYVFLTDEDNTLSGTQFHNDQAFFTVNGAINTTLYQASQFSSAQLNNGSNTIFSFQTPGYATVTYTVSTAGNYTFGFGMIDVGVNTIKSGLLVDNLTYTAVPEPATWAGGALLLGAAVGLGRRRHGRKA